MDDFKSLFLFFQKCSFTFVEREIISELYPFIKRTIEDFATQRPHAVLEGNWWSRKNAENYESACTDRRIILTYKEKIDRIVKILGSSDEKEEKFVETFPTWKKHREETIEKLLKTASGLKDIRRNSNIARFATGTVGIAGGVATIGSLLFPPAALPLLPGWLGTAVFSLLPSVFLPAAPAASSLAVAAGVAAAGGAIGNVGASVTELVLTQKSLDEAKEVIAEDRRLMKRLGIFEFFDQLNDAIDGLFGKSTSSKILNDIIDFLRKIPPTLNDIGPHLRALTSFLTKLLPRITEFLIIGPPLAAVILSIIFVVFVIRRRGCAILNYSVALGLVSAIDATVEITRLIAAAGLKDSKFGELVPRQLAGKVTVGAIAGIGITLDVVTVVLSTIELAEGSLSDEVKMTYAIVNNLQEQMKLYQDLNNELQRCVKRRLRRRWILKFIFLVTLASILIISLYVEFFV